MDDDELMAGDHESLAGHAARRLAALPAAAWHAWLAAHLAALRSGKLTPGQLP